MRDFASSSAPLPALCLFGCLAAAPVLHPANGVLPVRTDGAISVTSESQEYCNRLARSVATRLAAPPAAIRLGTMEDARHLRNEGQSLCAQGHLRAGIERLRRALVLLRHAPDPR